MDVRTLEYFVLVAEEGSITAGARRAMVAQPAVSVALKKLEREIGGPLFRRSFQGVELTAAGAALLRNARAILRGVEDAKSDARHCMHHTARTFTVGLTAGRAAAGELTGPILDAFQRANPDLEVRIRELDFAQQFDAVLDGTVEVAVVRSPYQHDDLMMEPLFSEPSVLVASPEHPLAELTEVPLEAVETEHFLECTGAPRAWRDFWNLAELREESSAIPSRALNLFEYSIDLLRNATVSPMAASGWRFGGLGAPALKALTLIGAPRSIIGVGYRRDSRRPELESFVRTARVITDKLVSLVPDAVVATGRRAQETAIPVNDVLAESSIQLPSGSAMKP